MSSYLLVLITIQVGPYAQECVQTKEWKTQQAFINSTDYLRDVTEKSYVGRYICVTLYINK